MSIEWTQAGAPALAAFLASLVEVVEALTVVLAVGTVRGWRSTLVGVVLALGLLAIMVAALGPALQRVPLDLAKLIVGCLLLLFGLRWLRKAMLRSAGVIALHDEQAAYDKQTRALRSVAPPAVGWDRVAVATSFEITMIEGLEVMFIVIAAGAGGAGATWWAGAGALAALVPVSAAGVLLHRPLTRVPENALKFLVGVLLSAFGTFWAGEGSGLSWPADDASIMLLAGGFLGVALLGVQMLRERPAPQSSRLPSVSR